MATTSPFVASPTYSTCPATVLARGSPARAVTGGGLPTPHYGCNSMAARPGVAVAFRG